MSWSCPFIGPGGRFYDECASLARCLYQEGSPEKIHEFAKRSQEIGVNLALKRMLWRCRLAGFGARVEKRPQFSRCCNLGTRFAI